MSEPEPPLFTYGTALVRTSVLGVGGGRFVWERRPGESGAPLARPTPDLARLVTRAGRERGVRPSLPMAPCPSDDRLPVLRYELPGAFSAARLLRMPDPQVPGLVTEALRGTGHLLAALHALGPATPTTPPSGPPGGVRRLTRWLSRGEGPGAAGRLHRAFVRRLGEVRRRRAVEAGDWGGWSGRGVLLHGAPGLGVLVPAPYPGRGALLTGEELALGTPEFDLGWLLGELAELRAAARLGLGGAPAHDYAPLARALLDGYGPAHPAPLARAALLRILTHVHDYAAYVGWHDDLASYLDLLADLVDDDGMSVLKTWRCVVVSQHCFGSE